MEEFGPGVMRLGDLEALIEQSPVATLIFGLPDQRIGFANEAVAELIGSPRSSVVGMYPAQLWHGAHGRRYQAALSALTGGALDSFRAVRQLHTDRGPMPVAVWARRMEVVGGSVALLVVVPEAKPNAVFRSVGAFIEPPALDLVIGTLSSDRRIDRITPNGGTPPERHELAGVDISSVVHPDDVNRLLSAIGNVAETAEDAVVRVRLRHAERGWTETRCLFLPLPRDDDQTLGLAESVGNMLPGPDIERIATLESHLLRFAAELHAGSWRHSEPRVDASRFAVLDQLPRRQREVVDRLLRGERISSIAASMYISASTVRNHLSRSFNAFGVHSQSELLALLRSNARAGQGVHLTDGAVSTR